MATNFTKRLAELESKLISSNEDFYVYFEISRDTPEEQHTFIKSSLWRAYLRAGGNPNAHGSYSIGQQSKLLRSVGKREVLDNIREHRRVIK